MLVSRIFAEVIDCEPRKEQTSSVKRQSTNSFCRDQPKPISHDSFADVLRSGLAVESVIVATSEGLPVSVTVFQPCWELSEAFNASQTRKFSEEFEEETSPLLKDEIARPSGLKSVTARLRYRLPGMVLSSTPVVIIAPAAGADRKLYRPLASFLAAQGVIAVVFDYRADLSSTKSALFGTAEMIHEAAYDLQSVLDWICHDPPEDSFSQGFSSDGDVSDRFHDSEDGSSKRPATPNAPFSLHIVEDYFAVSNAPEVTSSSPEANAHNPSADALPPTSTSRSPHKRNGRRHVFILGHGFGGLLIGSVLRASAHRHISGALLISAALPHTPPPQKPLCSHLRRLYWSVVPKLRKLMPCVFRAFGAMPGSFSSSALRWRQKKKKRPCASAVPCTSLCVPDFKPKVSPLSGKVGTFTRPVLAYSFDNDPDGPRHAVEALLSEYGSTDYIHRHRRMQDYGLKRGPRTELLFRSPNALWHEAAEWIWWTATWAEAFPRPAA